MWEYEFKYTYPSPYVDKIEIKEIVDAHAKEGWRLIGPPTLIKREDHLQFMFSFERPVVSPPDDIVDSLSEAPRHDDSPFEE